MSRTGNKYLLHLAAALLAVALLVGTAGCTREPSQPPPPKDIPIIASPSFRQDIQPILMEFCTKCHNPDDAHGGLRLNTYQDLIQGSSSGPLINPGAPGDSLLLKVMKHQEPPWMPFHGEPLTPNRITAIEEWLRMGAPDN